MRIEELPCYCISLARRPDRWRRFSAQPELAKLPKLERLDAVDGKLIDVKNDERINPFTKRNIINHSRRSHEEIDSAGAIGCALSHREAWRKVIDSGAPYGFIMEDDAVVADGFVDEMNQAFTNDPNIKSKNWDIIIFTRAKTLKTNANDNGFNPVHSFVLAHGYIVSRKAAQVFYDQCLPISHHIDFYMSVQSYMHDMTILGSKRIILTQAGQASDIQTKVSCEMCDTPSDWFKSSAMIPKWDYYMGRGSEIALLAIIAMYIYYRMSHKK